MSATEFTTGPDPTPRWVSHVAHVGVWAALATMAVGAAFWFAAVSTRTDPTQTFDWIGYVTILCSIPPIALWGATETAYAVVFAAARVDGDHQAETESGKRIVLDSGTVIQHKQSAFGRKLNLV